MIIISIAIAKLKLKAMSNLISININVAHGVAVVRTFAPQQEGSNPGSVGVFLGGVCIFSNVPLTC